MFRKLDLLRELLRRLGRELLTLAVLLSLCAAPIMRL